MEILALAGIPDTTVERASALAAALGLSLYEARRHLSLGEPRVLATFGERAPAAAAAAALRRAGFAPILLDDLEPAGARLVVHGFEFDERAVRVSDRNGMRVRVPFSEIEVLVRGVRAAAASDEREPFLEVHAGAPPVLVFRETQLRYDGLRLERQPTAAANFARLVYRLREHAGHAAYDERLNTRAAQLAVLGGVLTPEAHLEVATRLLAQTLRRLRSAA